MHNSISAVSPGSMITAQGIYLITNQPRRGQLQDSKIDRELLGFMNLQIQLIATAERVFYFLAEGGQPVLDIAIEVLGSTLRL